MAKRQTAAADAKPKVGEQPAPAQWGPRDDRRDRDMPVMMLGPASGPVKPLPASIPTYRTMRRHFAIAFPRAVATAAIRMATITVEADEDAPDGAEDIARRQWDVLGARWLADACFALDYGYAPWELEWTVEDGDLFVGAAKPLRADWSTVLYDRQTGDYLGLRNQPRDEHGQRVGQYVDLPPPYSLWYSHAPECRDWYGESVMERAREPFNAWNAAQAKYGRYLEKHAAPVPIIEFPEGESLDQNGTTRSNYALAAAMIRALGQCQGFAVPGVKQAWIDSLAQAGAPPTELNAWTVRFLETSGRHGDEFDAALHREEVNMARAWLVPERAIMEGRHGTNAEAEAQGSLVDIEAGATLAAMLETLNRYVLRKVIAVNFGDDAAGTVRFVADAPDPRATAVRDALVQALLGAPMNLDVAEQLLDLPAMAEAAGLTLRMEDGEAIDLRAAAANGVPPLSPDDAAPAPAPEDNQPPKPQEA